MNGETGIVRDRIILGDEHIPTKLMGRDEQIDKLMGCLSPALKGEKPVHAWLYGAPGTGKTAVVKHVVARTQAEAGFQSSYINCWQNSTFYSVIERIIYDLRSLKAERVSSSLKLETLQKKLAGRPYIVVLDEIDQPQPKERDAILYNLCNISNIGLVCICNSRRTLFEIEERIKSRLNPVQIEFPPYSSEQMIQILQWRVSQAFVNDAWDGNIVERIASMADGDARVAIHTLRNAARHADEEKSGKLEEAHVVQFNAGCGDELVFNLQFKFAAHAQVGVQQKVIGASDRAFQGVFYRQDAVAGCFGTD
jgi:orc1/cdc6 family replication initiation protein